jgi:3-methyladenine DNA glycosylase AlkD
MKRAPHSALQQTVREALLALAEPERASAMQAYMKSEMPYLGVSAPRVKAACRSAFAAYPFESARVWRRDVLTLWRGAKYREERYAAVALSGHRSLLAAYPVPMRKKLLIWSRSSNLWKRRTSIICQMFFREATDVTLLFSCIEPSLSSKEFFLRKAIGWALRQLAKHDPNAVRRYVQQHAGELSPLSRREALKHLSVVDRA